MPSLDPALESVVTALVWGLRALDVPFCIVGALVPELLLETKPESRTNDADVVVIVPDLAAFAEVKHRLAQEPCNFEETTVPHRLRRPGGGLVDVIPYSRELSPDGVLRLEPDVVMNAAGFDRVIGAAIHVRLDSGLELPVVPLPLFVLLKLVAYSDRKLTKDLEGVEHVLRHYASDDDRRWGLVYEEKLVEFDYGPAYLLGADGKQFLGPELVVTLTPLLGSLGEASTRLRGRRIDDNEWRPGFRDLIHWYRRGLGL
jgi:predicted nucleotidyltransferase